MKVNVFDAKFSPDTLPFVDQSLLIFWDRGGMCLFFLIANILLCVFFLQNYYYVFIYCIRQQRNFVQWEFVALLLV
jgi:hypothetical protein